MSAVFIALAALPWLQGFVPAASTDHATADVVRELAEWQPEDEACAASAYGGLRLSSELQPGAGEDTVLASYTQGIVVLDRDHHAIARAPGFTCRGSADELVGLAAGDAGIASPVLALAATSGGHNESLTWLTLYRVDGAQLVPAFTGVVERHEGRTTQDGAILLFPGGLVYRPPGGTVSVWLYDAAAGRYVQQFVVQGVA